jgi:phage terminase large subunit-like protein
MEATTKAKTQRPASSAQAKPKRARDPATQYAEAVTAGAIVAGPHVRAACARHLDDLDNASARGWQWHMPTVQRALDFFPQMLRLSGGEFEGKPFELHPSQAFIIASLFGWVDTAGRRRFRVAFVEMGKGNGKSPLAAGIGLYMMGADEEARAEIYAAAAQKDQAMVLFRDAVAMVDLSPHLKSRVHQTGGRQVWNLSMGDSFFRPISSGDAQSGPRPHCGLIDEVHEHKDSNVIEMMRAGFKGRTQPLLFLITNAGYDRQSVCWTYHDKAIKVAARMLEDDRFFSYVCALDVGDDPLRDETCWKKTNPCLGVSIQPDYLRDQVLEARQMPSKESLVLRLHFCQWVDAASPWISGDAWRSCEVPAPESPDELLAGKRLLLAVDLSVTTDLTALCCLWEDEALKLHAWVEFWTPQDSARARGEKDGVPYLLWIQQGFVHGVPGEVLDYACVADRIVQIEELAAGLEGIVFDRWRMKYLRSELTDRDFEANMVEHPQGFVKPAKTDLWMPQSVVELEAAVLRRELVIHHNPVLTWNAACAVVEHDSQLSQILSKRKSTGRIDGLVALAMAVGTKRSRAGMFDVDAMVG